MAELVELAPIPLRRPAGAGISEERLEKCFALRRRWAVVDEAIGSDRRTDSLFDDPGDLDIALESVDTCCDAISDPHRVGGLCLAAIDFDVSAVAGVGGVGASLEQADRPQPFVHAGRLHPPIVAVPNA